MSKSNRWLAAGLLVLSLAVFPHGASAHDLCFDDKTPYCFYEPFSDYWDANGGLPVFGYPVSPATDELNADTNKTYPTQWAERNRFEVHPENAGTPYAILLGLLGKDRLRQLGRAIDPREAGPKSGCLWFAETGHNVCNQSGSLGFKTYWENHGLKIPGVDQYSRSLQLFGLPLTEPREETNSSGDTVLTQWFERARFEWHPGKPDEFKVLLGLLGKEVYGAPPRLNGRIFFARAAADHVSTDLYVMSPDGSGQVAVTATAESEIEPVVSPDGSKIAFVTVDYNSNGLGLNVMNTDGSARKQLTTLAEQSAEPAWSPDGTKLAFSSTRGGNADIYVINLDGSGLTKLTSSPADDSEPSWSPDGKRIVFTSTRGNLPEYPAANDLYIMESDGGNVTRLTSDLSRESAPSWSPDGTWVLFTSFDGGGVVGGDVAGGEIYVIKPDGTLRKQISPESTGGRSPAWSPDGGWIVFMSARNPTSLFEIWTMKADGSRLNRLTNNELDDFYPFWGK